MAIPTPTSPSSITTVSAVALSPTINNRSFHCNSGVISADNTETTILSIDTVGPRDIIFCVNPFNGTVTSDHVFFKLKNNGVIIYQCAYMDRYDTGPANDLRFIIPANTSIEITFETQSATAQDVGVSCYGYYLESNVMRP